MRKPVFFDRSREYEKTWVISTDNARFRCHKSSRGFQGDILVGSGFLFPPTQTLHTRLHRRPIGAFPSWALAGLLTREPRGPIGAPPRGPNKNPEGLGTGVHRANRRPEGPSSLKSPTCLTREQSSPVLGVIQHRLHHHASELDL